MKKKEFPIKCLGAKFLVKAEPDESISPGGIILVREKEEVCKTGTIVSVGSKSIMKVNQRIMFRTLAMKTIKHGLEIYYSVPDDSVLVIFDKKTGLGVSVVKNRIIVKDIPASEVTKSGLFIKNDKEDMRKGVVLECNDVCDVSPGDTIIYNHDIGVKIDLSEQKYLVMRNDNIMAVVDSKRSKHVEIS